MDTFTVKITQAGWESFSGEYVGYDFKDGVSVVAVPRNVADRIAALVTCEIIDTDGANLGQGGIAARIASRRSIEATVGTVMQRQTEEQKAAEILKGHNDAGVAPTKDFYTSEQLEGVAELEGIDGLRKLADPWKVKDRSIPRLIGRIVKAQSDFIAARKKKDDEMRTARAAALTDAQTKQAAEERAFLEKARVLVDDQTPNAVDVSGKAVYIAPKKPEKPVLDVKETFTPDEEAEITDDSVEPVADDVMDNFAEASKGAETVHAEIEAQLDAEDREPVE